MNRKQFLWLMLAVVIMCGAGFALFWKDLTAYRDSGAKIGAQLLPQMKVSDVAKLRLQDATGEVTLAVKDKVWRVEQRGGYYEGAGCLRDMLPNHIFQLISLTCMEPPISFDADDVRDEMAKILHAINPFDPEEVLTDAIRGQYGEGDVGDQKAIAYRSEAKVAATSTTERLAAAALTQSSSGIA